MEILITGGTGFVGKQLTSRFIQETKPSHFNNRLLKQKEANYGNKTDQRS